jgi:cyclopropane fatty-acyl-phospholipid synthase-like methyltransferase
MPISRPETIPFVLHQVIRLNPKSILDVGVGFGINGVLFRSQTDIRMAEIEKDRYKNFKVRIDGIEIFQNYKNPIYDYIYDKIYYGDAYDLLDKISYKYDLIYLGDVIEHFEKERGKGFLKKCKKKLNKGGSLIITTPCYFREQTNVLDNDHEKHLSFWEDNEFGSNIQIRHFVNQKVIIINN